MKKIIATFFLIGCFWSVQAIAATETPSAVARLNQVLSSFQSLETRFTQEIKSQRGQSLQKVSGRLWIQRPNRFRWEAIQPYSQLVVADGTSLWLYEPDLQQVTVKPLSTALRNSPALLLSERTQNLLKDYDVRYQRLGEKEAQFDLIPKSKNSPFQKIRLRFSDGVLLRMHLYDHLGQQTHIEFLENKQNVRLNSNLFRFSPPKGSDVIRERG